MTKLWFGKLSALSLALLLAGTLEAQVFTPTYTSPRLVNEFGINVSDRPGNLTVEGLWRGGPLGLRVGYASGTGGLLSIGGELRNPLPMAHAPLGLAFTAGAQGLLGDQNQRAVGVQAGLSAGYTLAGSGLAFTPYLHPRIGLINDLPGEEYQVRALADAGVDVEFWNNLLVRLGVNLTDVGATWGLGVGVRR